MGGTCVMCGGEDKCIQGCGWLFKDLFNFQNLLNKWDTLH